MIVLDSFSVLPVTWDSKSAWRWFGMSFASESKVAKGFRVMEKNFIKGREI